MPILRGTKIEFEDLLPLSQIIVEQVRKSIVPDLSQDPHFSELFPFESEEVQLQAVRLTADLVLELSKDEMEFWYEEDCRDFITKRSHLLFSRLIIWSALQQLDSNAREE